MKSIDAGNSWKNVGLKTSEHIAKIIIDPENTDNIYVAAQGPLWRSGSQREGLYNSNDGGKSWNRILHVSDDTGISDVVMDQNDNDILYTVLIREEDILDISSWWSGRWNLQIS